MRYHHFLGIGHVYSNTARQAYASRSTSMQEAVGTHKDDCDQNQEMYDREQDHGMGDLHPTDSGEHQEFSDADSINTIDNGWWGWDDEVEDDEGMDGCESDEDLLHMDDMYG